MADTPDPQELARRYLDLWQQHLTQAATDPELAAAMAEFWQNLPAAMAPGIAGWPPGAAGMGAPNAGAPTDDAGGQGTASAPATGSSSGTSSGTSAGPASDPPSPDGGGDDIDELRSRMAALEKRLVALEPKPRRSGKRAAKGSGKRKS